MVRAPLAAPTPPPHPSFKSALPTGCPGKTDCLQGGMRVGSENPGRPLARNHPLAIFRWFRSEMGRWRNPPPESARVSARAGVGERDSKNGPFSLNILPGFFGLVERDLTSGAEFARADAGPRRIRLFPLLVEFRPAHRGSGLERKDPHQAVAARQLSGDPAVQGLIGRARGRYIRSGKLRVTR